MFWTTVLRHSRTTYRGARGSGPGQSSKTSARSSPASGSGQVDPVLDGRLFKRAQRGLFDGALPQSGNNIPNSYQKTLRTWRPNIQHKQLWSNVLGRIVSLNITTRAMRTMEKYGGLDAYIQRRDDRFLGALGRQLREEMGARVQADSSAIVKQVNMMKEFEAIPVQGSRRPSPREMSKHLRAHNGRLKARKNWDFLKQRQEEARRLAAEEGAGENLQA